MVCDRELVVGERALWYPDRRVVTCLGCELAHGDDVAVSDADVPGASARRTYDRRHAQREDHARQTLGVFGVALARLVDEPQRTKAWKRGAEGEERVGRRLEKLLEGSGVKLLHDRRIPRSTANIDHIAVGPGGITVIDTKNYRGKVRIDRVGGLFVPRHDRLRVNGRERTSLAKSVERQMEAVRRVLDQPADASVEIRGALCFADVNGLPLLRRQMVSDVMVDGPKPVARLARRDGALTSQRVEALWLRLARLLPPA